MLTPSTSSSGLRRAARGQSRACGSCDDIGQVVFALGVVVVDLRKQLEQKSSQAPPSRRELHRPMPAPRRWRPCVRRSAQGRRLRSISRPIAGGSAGREAQRRQDRRRPRRRTASRNVCAVSSGTSPIERRAPYPRNPFSAASAHAHGVAGAELAGPARRYAASLSTRCRNRIGRGRGHHQGARRAQRLCHVEDVLQHRPSRDGVQHLGQRGLHAGALSGGEDDNGEEDWSWRLLCTGFP